MSVPTRRVLDPIYGSPILRAANNGTAVWNKINTSSQWQNGTGWQACLTGGVQTGDDWGAAFFPVNSDVLVSDFNATLTTQWKYYMTATQTMGVNIVIWVHDPNNLSKRAEITQIGGNSLLGKTLGWNSHKLLNTTTQFVWYGEDWSGGSAAALTGSDLTSGTQYTWNQFRADKLFSNYVIYRVSLESGWEASGTFQSVWVTEAMFNGQSVPIIPSVSEIFAADSPLASVILRSNTGVDIGDVDVLSIAAGTNLIGKVGIDQATANANEVVVKSITAGSNLIGKFGIDQTTPGTTNAVAVTAVKTIQTELKAITAVAADAQSISSTLDLSGNIKQATILIDHAKDNSAASVGQGAEYVVQVSEKATGNDTWRALTSFTAAITAPTVITTDAEEAAGQTLIEIGATTPVVGDIIFWKNATIANSEWSNVIAISAGVSCTLESGLTNTQAQGTYNTQGEHFVVTINTESITRLRVVCNNTKGTTNRAIVWRVAAITVV
uniref:Uncharacterized protein n=1 Tax=viral metagenome TaxID=1070528 RepID=A0A6M3KCA3_9ZZZZ